ALSSAAVAIGVGGGPVLARPTREVVALGKVTQITFEPGLEIEPAISPDGKLVAYAAGPLSTTRIYVLQPGGRPVALIADSGPPQRRPLWSPDGTRILFETDADLFLVPSLGGIPRLMPKPAYSPRWPPEGGKVAMCGPHGRSASPHRPEPATGT